MVMDTNDRSIKNLGNGKTKKGSFTTSQSPQNPKKDLKGRSTKQTEQKCIIISKQKEALKKQRFPVFTPLVHDGSYQTPT